MKKVLTFGVYDYFHYGHLKLLEHAKALGDYLIVAVQVDEEVLKNKPDAIVLYSGNQRKELVQSIRFVDEVVDYDQVDRAIKKIDFDVFAIGEDQTHRGFCRAVEWCKDNGKNIVRMKRTPNISSSEIKKQLLNSKE